MAISLFARGKRLALPGVVAGAADAEDAASAAAMKTEGTADA